MKAKKFTAGSVLLIAAAILFVNAIPIQAQYYPGRKSAETAGVLSFFSTAAPVGAAIWLESKDKISDEVPFGVAAGGLILGPSVGYFYAGMTRRGLIGIGIRTALLTGTWIAASAADDNKALLTVKQVDAEPILIATIGITAVAVAALADIMLVQEYVKKRNHALRKQSWMVTPAYFAGHQAGGLQVQVIF